MKRFVPVFLPIVVLLAVTLVPTGCRIFGDNPGGPEVTSASSEAGGSSPAPTAVGKAGSVSFRIVLPPAGNSFLQNRPSDAVVGSGPTTGEMAGAPLAGIRAGTGTGTPTVTFRLILVNVGNTAQPTTTLSKTVPVDASGAATVAFSGVPALTCIGDIHIEGGSIASFTDFHGAADLLAEQENQVEIAPRNSLLEPDIVAFVLERVTTDPALVSRIVANLTARVRTALIGLRPESTTVLDDAVDLFSAFTPVANTLQSQSAVSLTAGNLGNTGGNLTVSSPTSSLNGLELSVPANMLSGSSNVTVSECQLATFTLPGGVVPATPLIVIENLVATGGLAPTLKIPVAKDPDDFAMAFYYDAATGRLEGLPPVELTDGMLSVEVPQVGQTPRALLPSIRSEILAG